MQTSKAWATIADSRSSGHRMEKIEKVIAGAFERTIWKVVAVLFLLSLLGIRYGCFLILNRNQSHVMACIANLAQIRGAKDTWAMDERMAKTNVPTWGDLIGRDKYLRLMPQCPDRGTYTLHSVGEVPTCSCGWTLPL